MKKLTHYNYVFATHLLVDVLGVVTKLCLVFQKKDLDLALVNVNVNHAQQQLQKLKGDRSQPKGDPTSYLGQFHREIGMKWPFIFKEP